MDERLKVVIRRVEAADCRELARLFDENNVVEVTRQFHPFPLNEETARYIACANHLDCYYIALVRDRVVGLCMLRGWDEGYSVPSLGVLVDRRFQKRGIGTQMTRQALKEAKELECDQVRLSVYASNAVALRLYASLGFVESERRPVTVVGQCDEKIVMLKGL